eukprot:3960041-Pyramimonas_sp.AAC.1
MVFLSSPCTSTSTATLHCSPSRPRHAVRAGRPSLLVTRCHAQGSGKRAPNVRASFTHGRAHLARGSQ